MKKSKKEKPRPRFYCAKCGLLWVSCKTECIKCDIPGEPLNEGAEKLIRKMIDDKVV